MHSIYFDLLSNYFYPMKAFVYTELYGFELNRLSCTDKVVFLKVQHVDVDTGQELNSGYSYFEKWLASRHYYVISLESSIRSENTFAWCVGLPTG